MDTRVSRQKWIFRNIKWLLEKISNTWLFSNIARNENLNSIKWLYERKLSYDKHVFESATINGNLENMKWLFNNRFSCDESTFFNATLNENKKIIYIYICIFCI